MIYFFRIDKKTIFRLYCAKKTDGGIVAAFEKTEPFERISVDCFKKNEDALAAARFFLRRKFRRWEEYPTFGKYGRINEWHVFDAGEKESLFGIDKTKFKGGYFSEAKEAYWEIEGPSEVFRTFADNPDLGFFYRPPKLKRKIKCIRTNEKEDVPIFGLHNTFECRTEQAPRDESEELRQCATAFRQTFALKKNEPVPDKATNDPDTIAYFVNNGLLVKKEGRFYWNP